MSDTRQANISAEWEKLSGGNLDAFASTGPPFDVKDVIAAAHVQALLSIAAAIREGGIKDA